MSNIVRFDFGGAQILAVTFKGVECVVARDLGRALEYSKDGKKLVDLIRDEWADEFQDGTDTFVLKDQEMRDFKALVPEYGPSRAPSLTLLTTSGVDLVRILSRKPESKALRRKLVDEVFPSLRETGTYSLPGAEPPHAATAYVAKPDDPATMRAKARLADATRRTAESKARALRRLLEFLGDDVDPKTRKVYEVKAAEIEVGQDLTRLLPVETEVWKSPSGIAADHDVTTNRVGRIVSELGIRGDERYCRTIANKSRSSVREVPSYLYNAEGLKRIETSIAEWKASRNRSGGGKACGAADG